MEIITVVTCWVNESMTLRHIIAESINEKETLHLTEHFFIPFLFPFHFELIIFSSHLIKYGPFSHVHTCMRNGRQFEHSHRPDFLQEQLRQRPLPLYIRNNMALSMHIGGNHAGGLTTRSAIFCHFSHNLHVCFFNSYNNLQGMKLDLYPPIRELHVSLNRISAITCTWCMVGD